MEPMQHVHEGDSNYWSFIIEGAFDTEGKSKSYFLELLELVVKDTKKLSIDLQEFLKSVNIDL